MKYLLDGAIPDSATKIVTGAFNYTVVDGILYYTGQKKDNIPRAVVPAGLRQKFLEEYYAVVMFGYFSGSKIFKVMSRQW